MIGFGTLGADSEETMGLRLKNELDILADFSEFNVFAQRSMEEKKTYEPGQIRGAGHLFRQRTPRQYPWATAGPE